MQVFGLAQDTKILPYIELIGGYKIRYKSGITQNNWPDDQKSFVIEPKPIKNSFFCTAWDFVIPESLTPIFQFSLENYAQLLPIDVEEKGQMFILNATTNGNDWLSFEESLYTDYDDGSDKKGKFLEPRIIKWSNIVRTNVVFHKDKIKAPIFHVKNNRNQCMGPYCTLGKFPEQEEFLALVLKYNMPGVQLYECELI
jgi:hypothetical protein